MGMRAQTLPPVPRPASAPPPDTGADSEAPPLASPPEEPQQGNQAADRAQTIMRQMMDMRRHMEGLADNYPPAAKDLRAAAEALKAAMLKIVSEVQKTPGNNPAPPVGPG